MLVMDGDREEEAAQATPSVPETAESGREEEVSDVKRTDSYGVLCAIRVQFSVNVCPGVQHVLLLDSYLVRVRASSGRETERVVSSFSVVQGKLVRRRCMAC